MIVHFEANGVEIDHTEHDILVIVFHQEDEHYLMIQNSNEYDEQDVKLGMDTYHIERDDQSYGGYGGVQKITLHANSVAIELDEVGRKNLQCEGVVVDFPIEPDEHEDLTEALRSIFGDALVVGE